MKRPEKKKKKPFEFNPDAFKPLPRASFLRRRLIDPVKSVGRAAFFVAMFAYPSTIVMIGVVFGGLVFWASLVGSLALIGFLIQRLGYSSNFQDWNISYRRILGLGLAGFLAGGFLLGLVYLKLWLVPVVAAAALLGTILFLKGSDRHGEKQRS